MRQLLAGPILVVVVGELYEVPGGKLSSIDREHVLYKLSTRFFFDGCGVVFICIMYFVQCDGEVFHRGLNFLQQLRGGNVLSDNGRYCVCCLRLEHISG